MNERHLQSRGPMTPTEGAVLGGLILLGLGFPLLCEMYDSGSAKVRVLLWLLSMAVSFSVLRFGLQRLEVEHARLRPAAVWALLAWSVVPLSQAPYLGYVLIPLEVILGALFASFRGGISVPKALLVVALARFLALGTAFALRLSL